jgi:hypothetical protein
MYFAPAASPEYPAATPTTYTVTCLPEETPDASSWSLTVEYRGAGLWAVTQRGTYTLSTDGQWDVDPHCRNDDDAWRAAHRFAFAEAMDAAKKAAPHVVVNGMTPADLLAWHAAGCPLPIPRPHSRAQAAKSETETRAT